MKKPVMLVIMDGWGINENKEEKNAIREAKPHNLLKLEENYPHARLQASGEAVGLPEGQMGNSEVGHLNIGAGRVVYQPLVEISVDIRKGDFFTKAALVEAFEYAKKYQVKIHFGGLLSPGGVHSHTEHLYGLLEMAKKYNLSEVYVHAFLDGRDTPPSSAINYVKELEEKMKELGVGKLASLSGRYYAMDRDKNWDRVEMAYRAMVLGEGNHGKTAVEVLESSYAEGKTDEFVLPTLVDERGKIGKGEVFINFNFRPDRAREITRALNDKEFTAFSREHLDLKFYCMRQYDTGIEAKVIYEDKNILNTFGEVISKAGLKQLRTAETEKYAHVTFFFNGGKETQYEGEDRILVPSPKVATYDLQPEMSAYEVTEGVLEALDQDSYDVIILNFANTDMVGHTGVMEATMKAVQTVDACIGKIADKILEKDGVLLITADHGNADLMEDPLTRVPFTAHTTNEVPCILVSNRYRNVTLKNGALCDLAPTLLYFLGIEQPAEMNGSCLIEK
ncbi:2,3-bisphosphoglycerate-independent phosphoglycerate mutase [Fusobacterium necrophorum]|uniref:2,3-bisphosphoglycerate-independent phosphoglycerate mutase n=1 Tax=Fusobacterium necrophorum TaxID=859 RepID=UPI0025515A07|nr:2,3-bisphosphoglycerate-independent phosphoglycerate mutase [Fusobacterium necrophorum]MDK4472814.1 2,3-bisphosphoglycerate-independent phosphoglycerate mutase [Fusobacterium necrophorum]MDK4478057.1 2,3-bisphosphoglycerate-independent phosphoglycerate mutase [Fusobacterium necrophorum]MDK4509671.1 2,3-bisphosphoglycerate-independent phosphoglycerate mutase [Fusobacterium necrophorum]MDK4518510.1 2,3-bisphosphoglycerate-independent phosphoglycerate mutase [Fusobacterium necrophorum]